MQDFDPVSFVQDLQLLHLFQLSAAVVTIWDHLILFDQEVELIWKRPGIIAKIFFVLTRYCGPCFIVFILIFNFTGANSDSVSRSHLLVQAWASMLPGWVVQVIMQFRVYAMYNRQKWVLAFTFTCFIAQVVVVSAFFLLHNYVPVISIKFANWTACAITEQSADAIVPGLSIMIFEGILFFFALYKTVMHVLRLNYPWTSDGAIEVLLRDNILYFLMMFLFYGLLVIGWFTVPVCFETHPSLFPTLFGYRGPDPLSMSTDDLD
ncbi:hypothetical protein JAAARDRAFT_320652 [Jaapia argillacea MUCL 33604]|uniref:DUF6533 domain-containing protein n=1 Tax=Jaapia argillacea MUCL 33604 TaxID=933084 RepID=A0A067PMU0_9AGAM|nr:hypothetical protein JAAARDRAFT_320652 [Jaapia argillacea MUCL 33604]